jgi:hypothetical protein
MGVFYFCYFEANDGCLLLFLFLLSSSTFLADFLKDASFEFSQTLGN